MLSHCSSIFFNLWNKKLFNIFSLIHLAEAVSVIQYIHTKRKTVLSIIFAVKHNYLTQYFFYRVTQEQHREMTPTLWKIKHNIV